MPRASLSALSDDFSLYARRKLGKGSDRPPNLERDLQLAGGEKAALAANSFFPLTTHVLFSAESSHFHDN